MAKRVQAMRPEDVPVPPPWERTEIHYTEVPAVLKWLLNRTFRVDTVYDWIRKGKRRQTGDKRAYLKAHKRAGLLYVKRADLDAFLDAT